MTNMTFTVGGLHCAGCVSSVERILRAQAGVQEASVDLKAERAVLNANSDFDVQAAIQAVAKAGFSMKAGDSGSL